MKNINWEDVQEFYNNNHFWVDVLLKFDISSATLAGAVKRGDFKTRGRIKSSLLKSELEPRTHTEETKKKISNARKKYLTDHPEKVPYLLNHSSKGDSYPEKYFEDILSKSELKYERYYRIGLYELDFAFLDKKIDLEIDGNQHEEDERIKSSDSRRDQFMIDEGWKIIRISWRKYQKLSKEDKANYIVKLTDYINNTISVPYIIELDNLCPICGGKKKYKKSKYCRDCADYEQRKIKNRPTLEELIDDVKKGYEYTPRKYGVSSRTIKDWIISYGYTPPMKQNKK